jgi:membrane-bound lytic murein transglycosylase B
MPPAPTFKLRLNVPKIDMIGKFFLLLIGLWVTTVPANYAIQPQAQDFIKAMVLLHGFDEAKLTQLFLQAERKDSILKAIARPAEKRKAWFEYRALFIEKKRIANGRSFLAKHRQVLGEVERRYGVPAEVIVAITGVETSYGAFTGTFRILDALATLAFDYPPRSPFFTKELEHYLLLSRDENWDALSKRGSYAGAMGMPQFMPSSYRKYAVDFDGDEVRDLFSNPADIFGSVANYFRNHGWLPGRPVVQRVSVSGTAWQALLNDTRFPRHQVAELKAAGVRGLEGYPDDLLVGLIEFDGGNKGLEYWAAFPNFYAITEYNRSLMYAMAVFQLSEAIAGRLEE